MHTKPAILIADDLKTNRLVLRKHLAELDVDIIEAHTGQAVLQIMETHPDIALLLLDIQMPDMDGYEVAKIVHSDNQNRHIPIIFITAMELSTQTLHDSYLAGVVDVLKKPVNPSVLCTKAQVFINQWSVRHTLETEIERRNEAESLVQHMAHHDQLTNLPNRRQLEINLEHEIQRCQRYGKRVAVLFLDLDGFKRINDTLGHHTGDQVLLQLANRFQSLIRSTDTVVRFGGDEFVILFTDVDAREQLVGKLKRLLETTLSPIKIEQNRLSVGVSIGVAFYPEHGSAPAELISNADKAMYQAKRDGRNTFRFYSEKMNQSVLYRLQMEEHLYTALQNNEFHILYQPIINLQNGQLIGAEALLRWQSPVLGNVSREQFIPVMEEIGLINCIGSWVLKQACRQLSLWLRQYQQDLKICVNVSSLQFCDPQEQLLQDVQAIIKETGLSYRHLELEITEGLLLNNNPHISRQLKTLHDMNIGIAIDDFGTGYSALGYLKTYPISTLKIDRSFIQDIPHHEDGCILVNAILSMAHGLNIKVIAEGIENRLQTSYLSHLACNYGQGYYFSKPLSADDFSRFLQAHNRTGQTPDAKQASR